jgi:hypothetical protein
LRSLAVGGSLAKLGSQKTLDNIEDNGSADQESQSGRLINLTWDNSANIWQVRDC